MKHPTNPLIKRSNAPNVDVRAGPDPISNVANALLHERTHDNTWDDDLVAARNTPPAAHY